jgi:hypothetical protein
MTETTLTTNRYIQLFLSEQQARENALRERREKMEAGLDKFRANCQVWLGDLWDEIEPGQFSIEWINENSAIFQFFFKWNGVPGEITDGLWKTENSGSSRVAEATLIFYTQANGRFIFTLNEKLQMLPEYETDAKPVDEILFGQYLCRVVQAEQNAERAKAEAAENAAKNRLANYFSDLENRYYRNLGKEDIQELVEKAVTEFPDHEVELRGAAREALKRIGEMEEEKRKNQQRREEEAAEEQRLEELARSMFQPMTVYAVKHTADGIVDGFYIETTYCLSAEPDKDGWWQSANAGIINLVKIPSILMITKIEISQVSDPLADLLYRRQKLTSDKFPGISVWALIRPDSPSS